jgi:hypothetical protein
LFGHPQGGRQKITRKIVSRKTKITKDEQLVKPETDVIRRKRGKDKKRKSHKC